MNSANSILSKISACDEIVVYFGAHLNIACLIGGICPTSYFHTVFDLEHFLLQHLNLLRQKLILELQILHAHTL